MATRHAQVAQWENDLLPNIVDRLAGVIPEAPYAEYPISPTSYDDGFQVVTYKDFANAINELAHELHNSLGLSECFQVLAYVGPNDLRYTALVLAAIKAGYVVSRSLMTGSILLKSVQLFLKFHATA